MPVTNYQNCGAIGGCKAKVICGIGLTNKYHTYIMEEAWIRLISPKPFSKPNWPLVCCDKPMVIEEDTSAQCYECDKNIWPAVPCATREHYYANGGRRRTPYNRIKYLREWMMHILGYPTISQEWRFLHSTYRRTPAVLLGGYSPRVQYL